MTGTRVVVVDPEDPQRAVLNQAADVLLKSGLVAFPTETFYGLGANALDPEAVRRIYAVKGRPESKPILVLVASVEMAESLVKKVSATARDLMARYWPGPLTLVFKASPDLPVEVTAGTGTVGIRVPGHPVAFGLVRAAGCPVTAPSANVSGEEAPTTAEEVQRRLEGKIELILDGGATRGGLPSTILDVTVTPPRLLRRGAIDVDA
ncbi:MAG: threonylcarbamoyl-AMP synthase [Candidatus Rokubacteria bacterium]|nr:threonylcarbamoyl-AMP synthase [Candidatus Rokubacteria bacterium]